MTQKGKGSRQRTLTPAKTCFRFFEATPHGLFSRQRKQTPARLIILIPSEVCKGLVSLDGFGGIENGLGNKKFEWVGDFASLGEFEVFVVGEAALFLENRGDEV